MDEIDLSRFFLSFFFVIGLIGLFWYVLKRYADRIPGASKMAAATGSARRLQIMEMCHVGPRQKLLLIRRDDREHLLYLGGDRPMVIESGIEAPKDGHERS